MCDTHQMVIDDIGEMICRPAIRFENDEIIISPKPRYVAIAKYQIRRITLAGCRLDLSEYSASVREINLP
jgi:hypothetical protein